MTRAFRPVPRALDIECSAHGRDARVTSKPTGGHLTRLKPIDVIVSAVIVVLLAGVFVAAQKVTTEADNRKKCFANLRQIGQALLLYSNENRGAYPRATLDRDNPNPIPVFGTPYEGDPKAAAADGANPFAANEKSGVDARPKPNDVTAALYLLLRTQEITSEVFVCPSSAATRFEFGGVAFHALHWTNWPGKDGIRKHLSYSYQNPYPSHIAVSSGFKLNNATSEAFALLADMNPGTDALLKLSPRSPVAEMRDGNSLNHAREGQNVLFGDGHVEFISHPFTGVNRDNIFTYGKVDPDKNIGGEGIIGAARHKDDSILLPAARDVGLIDENGDPAAGAVLAAPTAAEADALRKKLAGKYTRTMPDQLARLEITADRITASGGPMTVTYSYELTAQAGTQLRLTLTAPDYEPEAIALTMEDGAILISGSPFLDGRWKR